MKNCKLISSNDVVMQPRSWIIQHVVNKHQANVGRTLAFSADKLSTKWDMQNSHISRKWGVIGSTGCFAARRETACAPVSTRFPSVPLPLIGWKVSQVCKQVSACIQAALLAGAPARENVGRFLCQHRRRFGGLFSWWRMPSPWRVVTDAEEIRVKRWRRLSNTVQV